MSIQDEAAGVESVTFSCLGRDWSVPSSAAVDITHELAIEAGLNQRYVNTDLLICRTFLSAEDFAALVEMRATRSQLDDLATEIGKAVGMGGSGNSSPSPAS